jgi:hypothetical protein
MDDRLTFAQVDFRSLNTLKLRQGIRHSFDAVLTGHTTDFQFRFCHDTLPLLENLFCTMNAL